MVRTLYQLRDAIKHAKRAFVGWFGGTNQPHKAQALSQ